MAAIMTMNESQARQMEREAPNITAKYEVLIDAPIEAVWQALALDYGGIGKWASGVNHVVEFSGEGITAKRSCEINAAGFNDTREKIIRFEPEDYYFEYDLYGGLPGMVAYSINKDQLIAEDGKTHWISENEMLVKGILGKTMKGFMRKKLEDVLSDKGQELKHYIETGKPHPNKLKAIREKEEKDLKMRKKMVSFEVIQEIQAPVSRVWRVVAEDFGNVHLSNPIATHSAYLDGYDRPVVGAKRIMYMSENRKKYFVDRLAKLDPEKHLTIEIAEKKGFPIRPAYTWVNMDLEALASGATELTIRFNYLTKPGFLKGLAKSGLKKNFKEYAWAIDHHVMTGEAISSDNWKDIRKKYK
ncbi:MAG: SRPBCC family protein [Cytophagales bacterium]|nr:SRPBCC family protein [Cytophagales bacterium]